MNPQDFEQPSVKATVEEVSVDGGKVRLRTPLGEACEWRDYKAVNVHPPCDDGCCVDFVNLHEQSVNADGVTVQLGGLLYN